jgi:hypothetical protein
MNNKYFIRIINEEIKNFDFLNSDEQHKEQENIDLLMNEDLQKQFICDSLLNRNDKIKNVSISDSKIGGSWNEQDFDNADKLNIEYNLNLSYVYDSNKEPLDFSISFNGYNVGIVVAGDNDRGDYNTPPTNDSWFKSINWLDINVTLFTVDGEEIPFIAYKKAPQNIRSLFNKEFLEEFISTQTSMDILDKSNRASITQYC